MASFFLMYVVNNQISEVRLEAKFVWYVSFSDRKINALMSQHFVSHSFGAVWKRISDADRV